MKSFGFKQSQRASLLLLVLLPLALFALWMGLSSQFPATSLGIGILLCLVWLTSMFLWMQRDRSLEKKLLLQKIPKPLSGQRILIVEDRVENRELYTLYLKNAGAEVSSRSDGVEALKAILNPFDLILMDIQMPRMDGFEATHKIRSLGYSAPIIALTALKKDQLTPHWKNFGFSEILTKPIASDILITHLSEALNSPLKLKDYGSILNPIMTKNVLDKNRIESAPEKVLAIFKKFTVRLPEEIDSLASACEEGNSEVVLDLCHRLKGSSSNCGFVSLAASFEHLEDVVKGGANLDSWRTQINSIKDLSIDSIEEFQSIITSKKVEIPVHAP